MSHFLRSAARFISVVVNWFWITVDGSMFHKSIVRILYFPSLLRLSLLEGPQRRWYDRIDSTVIVGALPFRSQTKEVLLHTSYQRSPVLELLELISHSANSFFTGRGFTLQCVIMRELCLGFGAINQLETLCPLHNVHHCYC